MFCVPMKGTAGRRKGLKLPSIIKKKSKKYSKTEHKAATATTTNNCM